MKASELATSFVIGAIEDCHNYLDSIYKRALGRVQQKTGNAVKFPLECPYSFEQLLDLNWFPDRPRDSD